MEYEHMKAKKGEDLPLNINEKSMHLFNYFLIYFSFQIPQKIVYMMYFSY